MTRASASILGQLAGERRARRARTAVAASPRIAGRGHRPAAGGRVTRAKRAVGGAVEQAAGDDGGRRSRSSRRGPLSARWSAVPRPRQSLRSSRTSDAPPGARPCRRARRGSRTTSAPVHARGAGRPAAAPAGTRPRAGREPVATMTSSAPTAATAVRGRLHAEPHVDAERLEPPPEPARSGP